MSGWLEELWDLIFSTVYPYKIYDNVDNSGFEDWFDTIFGIKPEEENHGKDDNTDSTTTTTEVQT